MWRLRIGAEAGQDPHFFSTNNYLGRQIWEFHAKAGSVEELSKVEEARRNFANNRSSFKASADLLWLTSLLFIILLQKWIKSYLPSLNLRRSYGDGNNELLKIEPMYLQFPFELKKQMSCSLNLTNKTDNNGAFKVKTKNPKNYCVRSNYGLILPKSTCKVLVTMQAQKEVLNSDMQSNEKFMIQSVIASPAVTAKEVTRETVLIIHIIDLMDNHTLVLVP
ncbi:vesicle-associated protein 1-1 [Arabidopsis lyrata subsp. lyrata]|uniref:vesicle-associated protein 1-1 n=1 Tax=Arabidopsis lyrata subsp. lyrata TaxID=81972 RepID=UPI000A29DCB6|nr:vesicle-associated protein 1-1 [Arabidopsis lyrata subsp. lyrata]|eukprot:XP_020883462.1 vesicle-associated protein 1-1 [Arabidopsis lyrata subsp. lyrata]